MLGRQRQTGEESLEHHQRSAKEEYEEQKDADDDADQNENSGNQTNEGARSDGRTLVPSDLSDIIHGLHQRPCLTLRDVAAGKNKKRPAAPKGDFATTADGHSNSALHTAILLARR